MVPARMESRSRSEGLCVLLLLTLTAVSRTSAQSRTELVNALLEDYDNAVPPTFDVGLHTEVAVALYINSIDSINEQSMDFSVNAFVTQEWNDSRLQFGGLIEAPYLELDSKLMEKFWVPDLYFSNEKHAAFHSVTVPNRMLHLYSNGTIIYKLRISVTATCPMLLQKYPMDDQVCTLYIRSFAFSENYLKFRWRTYSAIRWNTRMALPQFRLINLKPRSCTQQDDDDGYYTGFTCVAVDFYLVRNLGYYMITIYIPSVLIVMLSWVSFWLSVDAVPARISLGILTVLTMTTQTSMAVSSLPKVSYVKAIDIWMATCLCFVFSSLLEYALVNVLERKTRRTGKGATTVGEPEPESTQEPLQLKQQNGEASARTTRLLAKRQAQRVDNISRCAFPAVFILFCCLYFLSFSL